MDGAAADRGHLEGNPMKKLLVVVLAADLEDRIDFVVEVMGARPCMIGGIHAAATATAASTDSRPQA